MTTLRRVARASPVLRPDAPVAPAVLHVRAPQVTVVPLEQAGITPDPTNARLHTPRTSDAKLNDSDARRVAIGSSNHEKATLTVRSVKMIAALCRSVR